MNDQITTLKDLLERSVEKFADRTALGFVSGEPITYAGFMDRVRAMQAILAGCGIRPEDKVALIGENMPNWAVAYFAITTMGAVAVPILQEFHGSAVQHILRHSESKAVVASKRYSEKVEGENFPELRVMIRMDDLAIVNEDEDVDGFEEPVEEQPATSFTEAVDAAREKLEVLSDRARKLLDGRDEDAIRKVTEAVDVAWEKFEVLGERARKLLDRKGTRGGKGAFDLTAESVAAILYTSGTTGHSKGVILTHGNLVSNAFSGVETIPVHETDRFLSVLPMAHTYECTVGLVIPIMSGSSVFYLQKPPTPRTLLPAMQKVKPTVMNVVPLIIEKIYKKRIKPKLNRKGVMGNLMKLGPARRKLSQVAGNKLIEAFGGRLRCLCIGGAALSPEVEKFLMEAQVPYAVGYGMTETAPLLAGTNPGCQRLRAIGPSVPGVELKILDPDPVSGEGEIVAKGPNIMKEYYKAPRDTEDTFTEDGWLLTGDLGVIDEDGYLYIKGRLKNVIIGPSGENIYPEEVESIINSCDFVMESLVYEFNGKICARIHLSYDALDERFDTSKMIESDVRDKVAELLEEIRAEVNTKVSTFARLAQVFEQQDPFEKTPTQKIKRFVYLTK